MKLLILFSFFLFTESIFAQHIILSNGQSSITIKNEISEVVDSFFNYGTLLIKSVDSLGNTIPCSKITFVIQPKKGNAIIVFNDHPQKGFFYLSKNEYPLNTISQLSKGSRIIFGLTPLNQSKFKVSFSANILIR